MPIAPAIGTLCWPRKSDIDSPMPVVRSFRTQKITVISGTLARVWRTWSRDEGAGALMCAVSSLTGT